LGQPFLAPDYKGENMKNKKNVPFTRDGKNEQEQLKAALERLVYFFLGAVAGVLLYWVVAI